MINFEIELDLRWTRNCITSEISKTSDVPAKSATNRPVPAREATITTSATFQVNNAKHLDCIIDSKFTNINRLFVLSFKNGDDDPIRDSFDNYYMGLVETKGFNVLIDNTPFFDQPVKIKHEPYEKIVEMSRNNYYTPGSILDFSRHQNY